MNNFLISNVSLLIICIVIFTKSNTAENQARLLVTAATALLIFNGEGNPLLESKAAIFVGEVSYSWYLIHWPVVCYQRALDFGKIYDYPLFIAISFILAVAVHFSFEKFYLKWDYYIIILITFGLAFGSVCMFFPLSAITPREIRQVRELSKNYSHLSREETIKLNVDMYNLDIPLLVPEKCQYKQKAQCGWQGFCEYEEPFPKRGNNTLMIIGNSWAANVLHLIHEECSPLAKNISFYSVGGCDVLPDVIASCKIEPKFVEHVEMIKPDVLIIIARAIDLKHIDDGMLPLEDSVFAASLRKLEAIEPLVRKKIFILNAFHNIHPKITINVNNFLKGGEVHPMDSTIDPPNGLKVARMRTEELVRRCQKCELIDYVPYLSVKNRVTLYDTETFVTFANSVLHLTLAGLEKIRPLYKEVCERLPTF